MSRKKSLKKKFLYTGLLLLTGSSCLFAACGKESARDAEEEIVLLDPVSVAVSCVAAEYRDIYDYMVIGAVCTPALSECVMDTSMTFSAYEKTPGEEVKRGDVLISGDTADLDKQIENQRKSILEMESNHTDELEQRADNLKNVENNYWEALRQYEDTDKNAPDEDSKDYEAWMRKHLPAYSTYSAAELNLRRTKQQNKESEELYALDLERQQQILTELERQKNNKMLLANRDGTVVALGYMNRGNYGDFYHSGDWIGENTIAMALGDCSVKQLRSGYLSGSDINKAEDMYALVNGERFEIRYEGISAEEYERIEEKNGVVYSTFSVEDPNDIIGFGTFATIVLEKEHREGVLALPTDCILRDGEDNYVYLFNGESYEEQPVVCGVSDGKYTEILSGLNAGDMVKAEFKPLGGAKETVLTMGSVHSDFNASGFLYYPSAKSIVNTVQYGTTYLDEVCVSRYEQVTQGQVIARIHVVSDPVEIERTEREITRLNEQIDYYKKESEKDNKYTIKSLQKQLEDKQDYLSKLKADAVKTSITAAYDGVITEITDRKAGELLDYNSSIGRLADEESCFVMVEDTDGKLSYGTKVEVAYQSGDGSQKKEECTVATVNPLLLDKSLQSGYAILKLPLEVAAEIAGSSRDDGWWSLTRVSVTAQLRSVENVLLVPRSAVTEVSRTTYVTVVEDNGTRRQQAFVPGGADSENYWVITGLTEGMRICWE
ncbi:MAG: hypothetical protein K6E50_05940 [Lachnospiraceae bacterium]|nr:hypothetical protein [Lachnospiraceae bacterium]